MLYGASGRYALLHTTLSDYVRSKSAVGSTSSFWLMVHIRLNHHSHWVLSMYLEDQPGLHFIQWIEVLGSLYGEPGTWGWWQHLMFLTYCGVTKGTRLVAAIVKMAWHWYVLCVVHVMLVPHLTGSCHGRAGWCDPLAHLLCCFIASFFHQLKRLVRQVMHFWKASVSIFNWL